MATHIDEIKEKQRVAVERTMTKQADGACGKGGGKKRRRLVVLVWAFLYRHDLQTAHPFLSHAK